MKLRIALYLLLLATLCMGCGGSLSMHELERLEARVNDAPDSMLAVLTSTDMPCWGEARALRVELGGIFKLLFGKIEIID